MISARHDLFCVLDKVIWNEAADTARASKTMPLQFISRMHEVRFTQDKSKTA
jgi:hypothetical protein